MKQAKATKRNGRTPSTAPNAAGKQTQPALTPMPAVSTKPAASLTIRTSTTPTAVANETRRTASPAPVTTIQAKIDVGFGNNLFVRGEGAGLSWDHGVPLKCMDSQTWQWTGKAQDRLTFKLLLNDQVWAKGEDIVVKPGQQVEVVPSF
jgi:hypothetical protein